jgi:hypothetical protein
MNPNEKFQRAVEALLYIASRTHENIPGFDEARKMSTMEAWWHAYMIIRTHAQNTLREIEILPYSCAEAGIPYPDYKGLPVPQCRAKFELANGEFVSRCHLDLGHKEAHEGWCLGSKCHWPQGFTSEEEVNRALDADIVKTKIEIIELEKDLKP